MDRACEDDAELRAEVELLLASHRRASSFIERPAISLAHRILQSESVELLVGQRFGHYELIRQLGAGGMGEVYLAADMTAGRQAALKFLPLRFTDEPGRLRRFEQEARAVVALNHPNIVTVYEIGEDRSTHFIASELINGETLRARLEGGPLEVDAALDVAIQVASALAAAHEAGVIHRDIKPENIMLRPDGYVKVLDFGIAKLAEEEATMAEPGATAFLETRVGSIMGTARYMSPEQARGDAVDQRTDIWSLGVVLYEMVTGQAPFHGENTEEVMTSILETEPPALTSCPEELEQMVRKTLRKEPNERHANAPELIEALKKVRRRLELRAETDALEVSPAWRHWRRWAAALLFLFLALLGAGHYWTRSPRPAVPRPEKSIAVLPFENLSENRENAHFAIGVQDEILSDLAQIADLKVISRTSTRLYESGKPRNSRQIGEQLGVAHLLEGDVQRVGHRVRIHVQLIDTRTDTHLWAQVYDRNLSDVFTLQSEIARTIAAQLQAKISAREQAAIAQAPTSDLVANDLYQQARAIESGSDGQSAEKAIGLLEQAISRDPRFVRAYCALGRINVFRYEGGDHTSARLQRARAAVEKAAQLQPDAGEVHLVRARYLGRALLQYDNARGELELARRVLPNDASVHYETALMDRRQGRWAEALRNFDRAIELDPRNHRYLEDAASSYSTARKYPEATRLGRRALALSPDRLETRLFLASLPLDERADLRPLRRELDAILAEDPGAAPAIFESLWSCAILERDAAATDRALAAMPGKEFRGYLGAIVPREWFAAYAARVFHRPEVSRAASLASRAIVENHLRAQPDDALTWSRLGKISAALGEKEKAIAAGQHACQLQPLSKEANWGLAAIRSLAVIYAWVGEKDLAVQQLSAYAQEPRFTDYGELKLSPDWDPLRGDPRFEALVARMAPDAGETGATAIPEKSIAVLPFEDLSDNRDRSGFGAGIQEDLLTSLAQIHDLKVISRTSVRAYQKADDRNIRAIGRALGVAKLLEGTVRRAGDRVLVNVQLIDARTDRHLWAEHYDRTVADAIGLQGELATQIAAALKATLAPEEKARLGVKPTANSEAYVLYLTALGKGDEIAAEKLYVQATTLDPRFALAYARASVLNSRIASQGQPQARKAKARAQAEEALRLAPTLGEVHMALGVCLYWGEKKYEAALQEFNLAAAGSPNNAEFYTYIGGIYRRQSRWRDAVASFDRAVSLDPRNAQVAFRAANNHLYMRNWVAAADGFNRALELAPNDVDTKVQLAYVELYRNGNPAGGRNILQNTPVIPTGPEVDGQVTLARWD
ncbi:MAG: FlgO family outer membrane protein, partial [Chthoniobacterales bacterium]